MNNPLGSTVREKRKAMGLTQIEAAAMLGVTNVWLCNIETGRHRVTDLNMVRQLANTLEIDFMRLAEIAARTLTS